jgi:hypothetical protein
MGHNPRIVFHVFGFCRSLLVACFPLNPSAFRNPHSQGGSTGAGYLTLLVDI